jgi:hypothetical protein
MVTTPLPAPAEPRVAPNVTAHAPQTSQAEKPEVRVAQVGRARELTIGGASMGDLSDRELNALLKAIDQLDAVPTTDVENAALSPLSPRKGTP